MVKYMIHACPERMWYVDGYLKPSMVEQGIAANDIVTYTDWDKRGNQLAFVRSLELIRDVDFCGAMWHLQDDVIIARNFATETQREYITGVVCGFCNSKYDNAKVDGVTTPHAMWFSMQCMRIPNALAKLFVKWLREEAPIKYGKVIETGKDDDSLFRHFMQDKVQQPVTLLNPNIVDHVDYLIGGTIINKQRTHKQTRSMFWDDEDLVAALERKLKEREEE